MYLESIKIVNFRIFKNFYLQFNKGLNIIVGENNSGKTALLDAIRYVLGTNTDEWIRITESDFHINENHFSIQLKFNGIEPKQASVFIEHLTYEIEKTNDKTQPVLFMTLDANITDQTRRGRQLIRTDLRSGKNFDGPRIESEIRNYLAATYLKPLRDAESEMTAGRGSRLSQILFESKEFKFDPTKIDDLIRIILEANENIISNSSVLKNRAEIETLLQKLVFKTDQFNPSIDIAGNRKIDEMSLMEKQRTFRSILEKLNLLLDANTPFQGLGYNNLLFMATELLLLQQDIDNFSLLLIEEPEAHLHPQLQMKLLKFIRDDYCQDENPKLQCILTTHSPNLASKANLNSLILMTNANNQCKAFPLRKEETELAPDDYIFLEKFLDVTKSNLFFSRAVIFVEGDGENILLPSLAKILDRPFENYGVSIVNIGNTAFSRYSKIFQRKGFDDIKNRDDWIPIKVACIRDLDLWPQKAEDIPENAPFGFIRKKTNNGKGNERFWLGEYDEKEFHGYINSKCELGKQNVKVFLSDVWTFEYSLLINGMIDDILAALGKQKSDLPSELKDNEEKSIYLYKMIAENNEKTALAYELTKILKDNTTNGEELLAKLPKYIVDAIEYVTEPLDSGPNPNKETANGK